MTWSLDLADVAVLTAAGRSFYTRQIRRLGDLGIDARHLALSHLAVRAPSWTDYLHVRSGLEDSASANAENVWNGRPISKILLKTPIDLGAQAVELIELIPPFHQRVYAMGLEHVGLVVGPHLEHFIEQHLDGLTGRQFQSRTCRPAYRLFDDYTHVKFYERSLREECEHEGARFAGIVHADWHPADPDEGPYDPGAPS
jgi:predicted metalloenzyme YecM